jgi:PmbA protein
MRELPVRRLAEAFDAYELCFIKERLKKFEAARGDLLSVELKEEEGISLRGLKDGKMIFSYTFEKNDGAVEALLENARLIAPFLEEDRFHAFPQGELPYSDLFIYDENGLSIGDDRKIEAVVEMESLIRTSDKRITTTRNCELYEAQIDIAITNSHGLRAAGQKTLYTLSGMAVAAEGDDEASWYDWAWSTTYADLDGKALGKRIAEKTVSFLGAEMLDTGEYAGLLPPQSACQLLEILSPSFLGENLFKNKTRLKGKEDTKIFSDLLTIGDGGGRGMGAFPFDGEGVPSAENTLVKNGVFKGFLYDTYYGRALNVPSTGNSTRSGIKDPPRCGARGFYIDNGSRDGFEGFDEGLVVDELMGTHTANTVTGDFSVGALGHYNHGGSKIPFKGVIFAGNLFEVLSNVGAVGKDLTFYGSHGSPTLLIEGLKISGK